MRNINSIQIKKIYQKIKNFKFLLIVEFDSLNVNIFKKYFNIIKVKKKILKIFLTILNKKFFINFIKGNFFFYLFTKKTIIFLLNQFIKKKLFCSIFLKINNKIYIKNQCKNLSILNCQIQIKNLYFLLNFFIFKNLYDFILKFSK